jgi:hypothetical protein
MNYRNAGTSNHGGGGARTTVFSFNIQSSRNSYNSSQQEDPEERDRRDQLRQPLISEEVSKRSKDEYTLIGKEQYNSRF